MTWGFVAGSAAMLGWEQRSLINQAPPLRCPLQGSRSPGPVRVIHRGDGGCNVLRFRFRINAEDHGEQWQEDRSPSTLCGGG